MEDFGDGIWQRAISAKKIERVTNRRRPVPKLRLRLVEIDEVVDSGQAGVGLKCAGIFQRRNGKDREEYHEQWIKKLHGSDYNISGMECKFLQVSLRGGVKYECIREKSTER